MLYLCTAVYVVLSPLLVLVALAAGQRPGARSQLCYVQAWAAIAVYLLMECMGTLQAMLVTLYALAVGMRPYDTRFRTLHTRCATWWCWASVSLVLRALRKPCYFRLPDGPQPSRPLVLALRHSSVCDTTLTPSLLGWYRDYNMRMVMKRELLWDPVIEAFGTRCDNFYLNRNNRVNMDEELRGIANLMSGPARDEADGRLKAVTIYPEGTRPTPSKRAAVLKSLERAGNVAMAAYAADLKATLPPRMKGLMALLTANSECDVWFVGHVGYDEAISMLTLVRGDICDFPVTARVFVLPSEQLPRHDEAAMEAAILRVWKQMDDWVASVKEAVRTDAAAHWAQLAADQRAHPERYLTMNV